MFFITPMNLIGELVISHLIWESMFASSVWPLALISLKICLDFSFFGVMRAVTLLPLSLVLIEFISS